MIYLVGISFWNNIIWNAYKVSKDWDREDKREEEKAQCG